MDSDKKLDSSVSDESNDTRFVIKQAVGETGRVVEELDGVFSMCAAPPLFQAGGSLVKVGVMPASVMAKLHVQHRRDPPAAIRPATNADLRRIASRFARFQLWSAKQKAWVDAEPSSAVLSAYLDAHGDWHVPLLRGLSSVPLLRADGTVSDEHGYDAGSGMFYVGGIRLRLPDKITRRDAAEAWKRVMEPFGDFPFASEIDKAVFAAYLLGLAARALAPVQPATVFGAPTYGVGKTKLASCAGLLAHGKEPFVLLPLSAGRDAEPEERKRFAALAANGVELTVIDNVVGYLRSPTLAAILTQETITDRLLGRNDRTISGLRPIIAVTANNAEVGRDLVRRVLWCYLDPGVPRPETRGNFAYPNLEAHIRTNRPRLLGDLFMVLAGFMRAGRPVTFGTPLGSFEEWYSLVVECVGWLGLPDPVASQAAVRAADDEAADVEEFVAAWHHLYGNDSKEAAEVLRDVQHSAPVSVDERGIYVSLEALDEQERHERMTKALRRVGADRPEKLGIMLKSLANRAFEVAGVGVVRVRRLPTNQRRWQVVMR